MVDEAARHLGLAFLLALLLSLINYFYSHKFESRGANECRPTRGMLVTAVGMQ